MTIRKTLIALLPVTLLAWQALAGGTTEMRLPLADGFVLEISDGHAALTDARGETVAENDRVARRPDPDGLCVAEGFRSVERTETGFEIHNQLCGGWYIIEEKLEFTGSGDRYWLASITASYTDRRTAEADGPPRRQTEEDFGELAFEDVDPESLYADF